MRSICLLGVQVAIERQRKFSYPGGESNSRSPVMDNPCLGSVVRMSDLYTIRRVASSILARGKKIFVDPGEHGFSSFQVQNVHWKCMCAAH